MQDDREGLTVHRDHMIVITMTSRRVDQMLRILLGILLFLRIGASGQTRPAEQDIDQQLPPMATEAHPAFDVATVKPSSPSDVGGNIRLGEHNVRMDDQSVADLIAFAYSLHRKQIVGGPDWLNEAHFDVQGQPDTFGIPDLKQVQEMLQTLLAERFRLAFHFEEQELPVFAITVDKSGAKLRTSTSHSSLPSETGLPSGAGTRSRKFTNCTMDDFALGMQSYMARPIVNQTNLRGRFDFELSWARDDAPDLDSNGTAGLFTAVREQLGLRMEAKRAKTRVLHIDRISRPTAN